jgi:hypothetical protein
MDHYFVSIMSWPENRASKDAMMKIARNIETRIGKEGDLPAILDYLPEEGLDPISVRYFHHHAWLNTHYYIASEDILQIGKTTDAVLAKYGKPGQQSVLLIVEYPSGEKASQAAKSFTSIYLPELREEGCMKLEDGSFTGIKQKGKILILVFDAPSGEEIDGLISGVHKKIEPNNP